MMTSAAESSPEPKDDVDVGSSTVDRDLTSVLSDLDRVRLKLERLCEASDKRSSELRIKSATPPKK
jgi:hypothetical protein